MGGSAFEALGMLKHEKGEKKGTFPRAFYVYGEKSLVLLSAKNWGRFGNDEHSW